MEEKQCHCECNAAPTLIFPCSGAADVGEISDRAARKMTRDGCGRMFCLAGIGGHVNNMLVNTEAAGRILVIDGCPVDCARKTLEHAGFDGVIHMRVTDLGFTKGKAAATDDAVNAIAQHGAKIIVSKGNC